MAELVKYYNQKFTNSSSLGAFKPSGYITDANEIKSLTAFFFWGSWVCGVERPGEHYSYTHNLPTTLRGIRRVLQLFCGALLVHWVNIWIGYRVVLSWQTDKLDDDVYTKNEPL